LTSLTAVGQAPSPGWAETAAETALLSGQFARANQILSEALGAAPTNLERGRLRQLRARLAMLGVADPRTSLEELRADVHTISREQPGFAARMLVDAALLAIYMGRYGEAPELTSEALRIAPVEDEKTTLLAATMAELGEVFAGRCLSGKALTLAYDRILSTLPISETVQFLQPTVVALHLVDDQRAAVDLARRVAAGAREFGAIGLLPTALCYLANAAFYLGEFQTTSLAAAEALQVARRVETPGMAMFAHMCLALVSGVRGELLECRRHVERAEELVRQTGLAALLPTVRLATAFAHLGEGEYESAHNAFEEMIHSGGVPAILWVFLGDDVEALFRLGRRAEAEKRLAELEALSDSVHSRLAAAAVHRCRGLLTDGAAFEAHFRTALAAGEGGSSFESARTELLLAERLECAGRLDEARQHAANAARIFDALQAATWARRASEFGRLSRATEVQDQASATIKALGTFEVERAGAGIPMKHGVPTTAVKVLVARGGRLHADELADVLWPGHREGRTRLRTVLQRVRAQYGPLLGREGEVIALRAGVTVDAHVFEAAARAALQAEDPQAALAAIELYRGELLPFDRYADWAATPRERLRRLQLELLELLIADAAHGADAAASLRFLEAAIDLEPNDEDLCVRAARVALQLGQQSRAASLLDKARSITEHLGAPDPPTLRDLVN
jgi:DNA-binding SARP family transcriptional activator/tetratricopeptide (TPR) repeat protein